MQRRIEPQHLALADELSYGLGEVALVDVTHRMEAGVIQNRFDPTFQASTT